MAELYPLILAPIFKERVWGGQGLTAFYGETLPAGAIGEAWLLSEHAQGTSTVTNGPLAGADLGQLRRDFGPALLGTHGAATRAGRCPLLIKLLDCRDDLSVQVHPADGYPALPPGELGKTEAWLILQAEPGAEIIYGLQPRTGPDQLAAAIATGDLDPCLRRMAVKAGDLCFVPAGTIHALGKGLLVAEVQQSSDSTYRVWDYNRPGLDGKPRELHLNHALAVTRYDVSVKSGPPGKRLPQLRQSSSEVLSGEGCLLPSEAMVELWAARIKDYRASGERVAAWCERNQVTSHQLYYWMRKQSESERQPAPPAGGKPKWVADPGLPFQAGPAPTGQWQPLIACEHFTMEQGRWQRTDKKGADRAGAGLPRSVCDLR